jgi:protein-glutamine gamma-glutamyltransferase
MAKVDSRRRPHWEDAAALILLCGGGAVAWWGTLGSSVLWLAPLVAIAALTAAGASGVRPALIVAVAWIPGALLVAGLPVAVLAPGAWKGTAISLWDGAEALSTLDVARPLLRDYALAAVLLGGGLATLLAGIAWRSPRRSLTAVGLVLALVPLGWAIAMQQTSDAPWIGALLLTAMVLRFAQGRFLPIATATALVGAIALFGAQVAAPRAGWQPFGHDSHPDQFHELTTKQTYGPLEGERTGAVMLDVTAPRPALWRMQVLEGFDNRTWRVMGKDSHLPEPDAREESIEVDVRGLRNTLVVSPGEVTNVQAGATKVTSLGDGYMLAEPPSEGDTYRVEADTVHASAAQLASIPVPPAEKYQSLVQIGLGPIPEGIPIPLRRLAKNVPTVLQGTDWAKLFHLSAKLSRGAGSELAVVRRTERYLRSGRFHYTTEVVPPTEEPLLQFLFHTHAGYCQQFAGAEALLLRISGVPARVAVGFATGEQVGSHTWAIRDEDAHAWTEVYFPTVGWVPFNPTPKAAEADVAPGIDVLQAVAGPPVGPGGLASGLAGAAAALLLLLVAARLIGRRGPRAELADLLVRLSPQPSTPRTTLRSLHPTLTEIGPATADLAFVAERARFGAGRGEEPARPGVAVWRALISDVGFLRASALMLRAMVSGPRGSSARA